ncbi:hypothetical protein [Halobacillus sp. Nhm2S1]|uniref:hypothetical protein n=1 Tax=Halobacillus sp. Nhm2S1 TaxID=2866716 RepID=UPI001C736F49|nr:hypothetical protein [Halobacillus sp. Nhm2S1]MBX0358647.1 hypothetical protein [Halobacillus sp. Nhm2S1]
MKKVSMMIVLMIAVCSIGILSFIRFHTPLVSGAIASSADKQSVVISIGNQGFSHIKIHDVQINNDEEPVDKKIQVSHPLQGFIIADRFDGSAIEYGLTDIKDVTIKPNTSPSSQLEKLNNGTATKEDLSYGLTIINNQEIREVMISYSYLGMAFEKSVSLPH